VWILVFMSSGNNYVLRIYCAYKWCRAGIIRSMMRRNHDVGLNRYHRQHIQDKSFGCDTRIIGIASVSSDSIPAKEY